MTAAFFGLPEANPASKGDAQMDEKARRDSLSMAPYLIASPDGRTDLIQGLHDDCKEICFWRIQAMQYSAKSLVKSYFSAGSRLMRRGVKRQTGVACVKTRTAQKLSVSYIAEGFAHGPFVSESYRIANRPSVACERNSPVIQLIIVEMDQDIGEPAEENQR